MRKHPEVAAAERVSKAFDAVIKKLANDEECFALLQDLDEEEIGRASSMIADQLQFLESYRDKKKD